MAKAEAVEQPEHTFVEVELERSGDAMIMLIPRSMWETLLKQGNAEGIGPAQVLDKALWGYLEAKGSPEAVAYLHAVAERSRRG